MSGAPKFVRWVLVVAVLSLTLTVLVFIQVRKFQIDERHRDCVRAVTVREDGRAMWLYLVDQNGDRDPKRTADFVAELNNRLPSLKCTEDGDAVPAQPGEN